MGRENQPQIDRLVIEGVRRFGVEVERSGGDALFEHSERQYRSNGCLLERGGTVERPSIVTDQIFDADAFLHGGSSQAWSLLIAALDFVENHRIAVSRGRGLDPATPLRSGDGGVLSSRDRFRGARYEPAQQRRSVE